MYVVSVTVHVKPDQLDDFIQATLDNARHTRQEPGNIRFDVLQAEDDRARFLLHPVQVIFLDRLLATLDL